MIYYYQGEAYTKHKHPLYYTWKSMNDRCYRKYDYSRGGYYGEIEVCSRWLRPCFGGKDPRAFQNFCDDMGPRPPRSSLDRIDPTKGYSPENCRWATYDIQGHNKKQPASCIAKKYTYRYDKDGKVIRTLYHRIVITHKGKRYVQHVKKGETPRDTFLRLKQRVSPELEDWAPTNDLAGISPTQ